MVAFAPNSTIHFNLSPQGDGNQMIHHPLTDAGIISTYPRKGTET